MQSEQATTQPHTDIPPQDKGASKQEAETWTLIRRVAAKIRLEEHQD